MERKKKLGSVGGGVTDGHRNDRTRPDVPDATPTGETWMRPSRGLASLGPLVATLALWPTGSGAAQAERCGVTYTVRAGDTMGVIATRCATSVEALMQANPEVSDPARISIGQELAVPPAGDEADAAKPADAAAAEWARRRDAAAVPLLAAGRYAVEPGDDMASIATKLGVPLRELLAANEAIDPFALQPGQVLALPDPEDLDAIEPPPVAAAGDPEVANDVTAAAGGVAGTDAGAKSDPPGRYTVEPGDSLSRIAAKAGVPLDALIAANERVKPRALRPGQSLVLPDVARNEDADPGASNAGTGAEAEAETAPGTGDQPGDQPEPRSADPAGAGTGRSVGTAGEPERYRVEPGDSLAGIAARTGVRLAELMAVNEGVEPRALRPGQELVLPGPALDANVPAGSGGVEGGPDLAAAPEGGDGPAAAGAAAAEPEPIRLEGRIRRGVECPVLKTPDGRTYSLVSQAYGFTPGDYVAIEAEPVEVSFCMQGQTVRVTSMKPRPAPQGG